MYTKTKLDNGLKVVTNSMPGTRSVALGIWANAGGRYEGRKNKGIAHFLEHLLFKGTKKYSIHRIKESIEGVGGSLNGFTSEEFTCYLVKIPSQHLKLSFDVLSDMVLHPLIPQEEVQKERTVIIEEIKMYKDMPQSHVYELLDELLWPGQPLGESIAGSIESVSRLGQKDLLDFKENYYTAPNLVVSACGNLSHKQVLAFTKEIFKDKTSHRKNTFSPARENQKKPQLKVFDKATEQTHMALGFHGLERNHPDKFILGLLHIILGGNMSSRLFNEVREKKGLAYEIGTQVKFLQDTGAFLVHAGIDNKKVTLAIKLILKELTKVKKGFVRDDELKRAKEFYLGQLTLALEDNLDHMLWIGETVASLDKIFTWQEILKAVNKVSRSDIKRVAADILKEDRLNLSIIGPLTGCVKEINSCLEIS
ncbi:MAG: pitrilysin family protein [Candidatus Omnitrophica bacterium]|nr:pitrilysin family protein [Candidatus Omnitrophota bacterium]